MEEFLEIVDGQGSVISIAPRSVIHSNPSLLHRAVHILVFNSKGELLLQKRSHIKKIAPQKWDTSVGGHVMPGEDILTAAKREMLEELGVVTNSLRFLYTYIYSDEYESELVYTYWTTHDGPFDFNRSEIEEIAFWKIEDIRNSINFDFFSNNFKHEFFRYLSTCLNIPIWFRSSEFPMQPLISDILKNL
uniref:NUDIX domain-containing protein n=1 Tax=Thermodesulfovibrio aggregans TaxID=86166 RepID=A0A7C4AJ21_9BACT